MIEKLKEELKRFISADMEIASGSLDLSGIYEERDNHIVDLAQPDDTEQSRYIASWMTKENAEFYFKAPRRIAKLIEVIEIQREALEFYSKGKHNPCGPFTETGAVAEQIIADADKLLGEV